MSSQRPHKSSSVRHNGARNKFTAACGGNSRRRVTSSRGQSGRCVNNSDSQCSVNHSYEHALSVNKCAQNFMSETMPSMSFANKSCRKFTAKNNSGNTSVESKSDLALSKPAVTSLSRGNSSNASKRNAPSRLSRSFIDYILTPVKYIFGRK